eukprot:TRINITY_DN17334_c0_g2_i4.p1 TRINITY_DN17334_c0_g2~~TRINITY_DN17334_c0_g2_i4.p1  ORF type:complete len:213 (+),score=32.87 TRINITY_DN17334_c0_g2_i4:210-848(+)
MFFTALCKAYFLLQAAVLLLLATAEAYQLSYRYFTDSRSCFSREGEVYAITVSTEDLFYIAGRCSLTGKAWIYQLKDIKLLWNMAAGSSIKKAHVAVDLDSDGGCVIADHNAKYFQIQSYDSESGEKWQASSDLLAEYKDMYRVKAISDGTYVIVGRTSAGLPYVMKLARSSTQPYALSAVWICELSYADGFSGVEENSDGSLYAVTGYTYQ